LISSSAAATPWHSSIPGTSFSLAGLPNRIDLLTGISGVTWEEAWASRTPVYLDGLEIQAIGKTELMRNKQATGRPQDLADLARLRTRPPLP